MLLLLASRQVCPAFLGRALLAHSTAACQTWHFQLLGAKEKALLCWGPFLTALGAGYSPVTSCHFKECFFWFRCNELSVVGCVSLHLSASILASMGTPRWVGLDLLALGLFCQLENWLIASQAELAGVSHCSPRSACLNMASFCGCFGSVVCSLQPRRMWKWMPVSS